MKIPRLLVRCATGTTLFFVALTTTPAASAADDESTSEGGDESSKQSSSEQDESDDASKSEEKSESDEKKDGEKKDDAFGHGGQVGLRVGVVGGYRMILRYDDSPLCAEFDPEKTDQQKFCGHVAPFAMTTALSYGIADWLEPFAWGRFGLEGEDETYTEPVVMFGLGVRVYTMSDAPFKIFIEPSLGLEVEDGRYGDYDTDFALHLAAGPTFDFARYFGAYLTAGVTTTVVRYLAASLDVEFGIQGRY